MDIEPPNVYQVLSNLQKKIAFLFQDLVREKNDYKQNSENLNIKLEQLSADTEIIKKENEVLREIYDELKKVIFAGVRVFTNTDFSSLNLKREHVIELENLKTILFDTGRKLENFKSSHKDVNFEVENSSEQTVKAPEVNLKRYMTDEEEIQKEFESIKELKFSTQFFNDDETEVSRNNLIQSHEKESVLNRKNAESVLRNLFERKPPNTYQVIKTLKDSVVVRETETFYSGLDDSSSSRAEEPSSAESHWNKSPVFKDFVSRKQDGLSVKEFDIVNSTSSPVTFASEEFVEKPKNFIISPWKKSGHVNEKVMKDLGNSPKKGCSTPKRARKKLEISSPKISPKAPLKKSNSREAEISTSGVRKLTQTLLNIECYKKKGLDDWKSCENRENKDFGIPHDVIKREAKVTIDLEEDDFITESPKKTDQLPEEVKSRNRKESALKDVQLITPPETSVADLDETYISASIIKNCELTKKHLLEKETGELTPLKRPAREKSPEYDSVPFIYKRDPVRKKAERMKLPGHACFECNKYYENALGDIDTQSLKKILNKCSRHRDKNSPTHDETPPGYWKPYLTCSIMMSPKDKA